MGTLIQNSSEIDLNSFPFLKIGFWITKEISILPYEFSIKPFLAYYFWLLANYLMSIVLIS